MICQLTNYVKTNTIPSLLPSHPAEARGAEVAEALLTERPVLL